MLATSVFVLLVFVHTVHLAMTGRAARQLGRGPKVVRLSQLCADFRLIIRSFPVHVENLVFWAKDLFGIAMAVQAPLHEQRVGLEYQRHLVDLPVARRAAYALVDMNAVIEVDEIS